jgi:diamine N-acetyltransferase
MAPVGDVTVRKATRQDAGVIGGLNNHVHELHVTAEPYDFRPTSDSAVEAFFASVLGADDHVVLLASIDDVAVGYLWAEEQARSASPFKNATRAMSLNHIAVDPMCRRRGFGRALYREAEAEARRRGIDRLVMDHWTFNTAAAAFFGSLGFESFNIRMRKLLPTT